VARFLHVHLEKVAHVVERRRGKRQTALLFHRARLGVALRHDQAAQFIAMLAGNFLPALGSDVITEVDVPLAFDGSEKNSPAVFGHAHVVVHGPTR